jgi:hypothetical protein
MIAISELQDVLYKIYLRSPNNLFDEFVAECQKWYNSPAHTLTEMKTRDNKKIRGDIFEAFSILYLKYVKCYKNVWLLHLCTFKTPILEDKKYGSYTIKNF